AMPSSKALLAQVHAPFFVELPEPGVPEVFDEADSFSRTLHLRPELLVHMGEFVETEYGFLDGKPLQVLFNLVVGELFLADHDLGGYVEIGDAISLGNKGG